MTHPTFSKAFGLTLLTGLGAAMAPGCGGESDDPTTGEEQDVSAFVTDTFASTALLGGCSVKIAKTGKTVKTKGSGGKCPDTVTGVLDTLQANAKNKLHTYVVSEEGDITPGKNTHYRFVIAVDTGDGKAEKLFLSVLGTGAGVGDDFMEVMSFNEKKGVYAYYDLGEEGWVQEGDGTQVKTDALADDEPPFRCVACHTTGQPLMKELHDSWANWNSTWFSMPDPAGLKDPLLKRLLSAKERADDLELFVIAGTKAATKTRVDKAVKEKKLKPLLTQLMCDVGEPSLIAAHSKNSKRTGTVETFSSMLPSSILLNNLFKAPRTGTGEQKGMEKLLDMNIPSLSSVRVDSASYVKALNTIGQTIGGSQKGDAMFPMSSPEKSFADVQMVQELFARKLVDKDVVADVLMTDFTVSTFSKVRCDLAATIPTTWKDAEDLRAQWVTALGSSSLRGAKGLGARLSAKTDFDAHVTKLEKYVGACNARGTADKDAFALDLLKVMSQRRAEFEETYANVVESPWLLPGDTLNSKLHANRLNGDTCVLEAQTGKFVGEDG